MRLPNYALLLSCLASLVVSQKFNCEAPYNCVDRPTFSIQAIVHGTRDDPFWQQMQAAMYQAASDLNVTFNMSLYETFDNNQMASDVSAVAGMNPRPDALIVSIPDAVVQNSVGNLIQDTNQVVFGVNVGANLALPMGIIGFVAIDDYLGGEAAGKHYIETFSNDTSGERGLFVNPEFGNVYLEERFLGMKPVLDTFLFDDVNLESTDSSSMVSQLSGYLTGCPYSFILLARSTALDALLQAMEAEGCSYNDTFIGTFDVNTEVYQALADDKLDFAISQQAYLQGATTAAVAAVFVTTGKTFARSLESVQGEYLSGPVIVTKATMPSQAAQTCELDAFPVCPNTLALDGTSSSCPCANRSELVIAGVTHGSTSDSFWDEVYAAAEQAAVDFDIKLLLVRLQPQSTPDLLFEKYIDQIHEFCDMSPPVDGLFVALTNQQVVEAVQYCVDKGINVVSINTGAAQSVEAKVLTHIGQSEISAGKGAGQRLIDAGVTRGACVVQDYNNVALAERCQGMQQAFEEIDNVEYIGTVAVSGFTAADQINKTEYFRKVEQAVGESGSWSGVGALVLGANYQLAFMLELQTQHPDLKLGCFDTSIDVFNAISTNKLLFTVDQNSYLQGYWPIPFLTWYANTNEFLANNFIESGPRYITEVPNAAEQACASIFYESCPNTSVSLEKKDQSGEMEKSFVAVALSTTLLLFVAVMF